MMCRPPLTNWRPEGAGRIPPESILLSETFCKFAPRLFRLLFVLISPLYLATLYVYKYIYPIFTSRHVLLQMLLSDYITTKSDTSADWLSSLLSACQLVSCLLTEGWEPALLVSFVHSPVRLSSQSAGRKGLGASFEDPAPGIQEWFPGSFWCSWLQLVTISSTYLSTGSNSRNCDEGEIIFYRFILIYFSVLIFLLRPWINIFSSS